MGRCTRRTVVRLLGIAGAGSLAGCLSSSNSADAGSTTTTSGTDTSTATTTSRTDTTTATTTSSSSNGAASSTKAIRRLYAGLENGDLDRIREVAVGFENLDEGQSSDATLFLPSDGDPLTTNLNQGTATAKEAYGNFAPDGRYLSVATVSVDNASKNERGAKNMNDMTGPDVETALVSDANIDYRINIKGEWYDSTSSMQVITVRIDGEWYTSTLITPWYVITGLLPDEAKFTQAQIAEIKQTLALPLGED